MVDFIDFVAYRVLDLRAWALVVALVMLATCLVHQLRILDTPIMGHHQWRGAATYSVAWNYAHTTWNFFLPVVDWRSEAAPTGITTMETPSYVYLCGMLMRLLGDDPIVCRCVNFLLQLLSLGVWAHVLARLGQVSLLTVWLIAWAIIPAVAIEFRQIQPDPFVVGWALTAAACMHMYGMRGRRVYYACGFAAYTLACASKPTAIGIAPAILMFSLGGRWRPVPVILRHAAPLALPIGIAVVWHFWNFRVIEQYHLTIFETFLPVENAIADLKNPDTWTSLFSSWFPQQLMGWFGWPLLLIGMGASLSQRHRTLSLPFWCWLVGSSLMVSVTGRRVSTNLYYLDPLIVPCAYFIALALEAPLHLMLVHLRSRKANGESPAQTRVSSRHPDALALDWQTRWATMSVLLLGLVLHVVVPEGTLQDYAGASRYWFSGTGVLLLAAIIVFGAASADLAVRRPVWRFFLAGLAFAVSCVTAHRAEADGAKYHLKLANASFWFDADRQISELRNAVDRYSTRDDAICVSGRDPAQLHWALRWGMAEDPSVIAAHVVQATETSGPTLSFGLKLRLFIHFKPVTSLPAGMERWEPLAQSAQWAIYCVDPNGCTSRRP